MIRLPALPPVEELAVIDAALARAATCPGLHHRVNEILCSRRTAVETMMLNLRNGRLDVGEPEACGEARWRAWGGCWSCRARAEDGSPRVPCGCRAPSPPMVVTLDPWEADYATYVRSTLASAGGETPAAREVPRDPEAALPGGFDGRWGAPATARPAKQPRTTRRKAG